MHSQIDSKELSQKHPQSVLKTFHLTAVNSSFDSCIIIVWWNNVKLWWFFLGLVMLNLSLIPNSREKKKNYLMKYQFWYELCMHAPHFPYNLNWRNSSEIDFNFPFSLETKSHCHENIFLKVLTVECAMCLWRRI